MASKEQTSSSQEIIYQLLSLEVFGQLDVEMNASVDEVLSGRDKLGSSTLSATLKHGRFLIDSMTLNIPGDSFSFAASLKPDTKLL